MQDNKLPPFIQLYETEGAKLWLNSGNPVRASVVWAFLSSVVGEKAIQSLDGTDTFLTLEGYVYQHEIDAEKYPSLSYYFENRGQSDIASLWQAFNQTVQSSELRLIRDAFLATRQHPLETMAGLSEEEKKSASTQKSTSTSKPRRNHATDTKK